MSVYVFRREHSSSELRRLAGKERDGRVCRRLLLIAHLLDGLDREEAARLVGLGRQAAYDWLERYEEEGIAGLPDRPRPGRPRKVAAATGEALKTRLLAGATVEQDTVVAFRGADVQRILRQEFQVEQSLSSTYRVLHRLTLSWLVPRPRHPQADAAAQAAFRKPSRNNFPRVMEDAGKDKHLEVWFQDEARLGQKNRLTRVCAATGSRPQAPQDHGYESVYLFGAVCASERKTAAVILPVGNTFAMNHHLQEISRQVGPQAHAALLLDQASYHNSSGLRWPDNITPIWLPPYSPELNRMEIVWHYLRSHWLSNTALPTYDDVMTVCERAWNRFAANPDLMASLCQTDWAIPLSSNPATNTNVQPSQGSPICSKIF